MRLGSFGHFVSTPSGAVDNLGGLGIKLSTAGEVTDRLKWERGLGSGTKQGGVDVSTEREIPPRQPWTELCEAFRIVPEGLRGTFYNSTAVVMAQVSH